FQQGGDGAVNRTIQDKLREFVHVEDFGAISYTETEIGTLNGGSAINTAVAANDAAFAAAFAAMAARGGGTVYGFGQCYVVSEPWRLPDGVYFEGSGHGKWMPSLRTVAKT